MADPIAVSRKLVAVFAADVEGYSRLMGADEVGTLRGLTERRAILDRLIAEHRGRIANTAGDSVLAREETHRLYDRRRLIAISLKPASKSVNVGREDA